MLRPWDSAFLDLHRQVDEMFEELVYRPWAIPGRSAWRLAMDFHETADGYLVVIDLPGVAPENVRIAVGEHDLVIAGLRAEAPPEGVLLQRCERPMGSFERTLKFPQAVDARKVRADYVRGTCRIQLPKKVSSRPPEAQPVEPARYIVSLVVS